MNMYYYTRRKLERLIEQKQYAVNNAIYKSSPSFYYFFNNSAQAATRIPSPVCTLVIKTWPGGRTGAQSDVSRLHYSLNRFTVTATAATSILERAHVNNHGAQLIYLC
jgi:hypothetical protein